MNVKESLLYELARNEFISGGQLAEKLGVSRNAVWKAVRSLESEGCIIESVPGKGYRISAENNKLYGEIIKSHLSNHNIGHDIIVLDSVDSTNNYAKNLAVSGAEHGTVVIAEYQTAGRGRLGRNFVSPRGKGLYMSIIIRPDYDIQTSQLVTSCTACSVASAIEKICRHDVGIKWVNDLYMNGKKICGILTEASLSMETGSPDYIIIGIGIDVRSAGDEMESLKDIASSIEDETGIKADRNILCAAVLDSLDEYMTASKPFLDEYRQREILTGHNVTVISGKTEFTGKVIGIDDNAALMIEMTDGTVKTVGSGEATIKK